MPDTNPHSAPSLAAHLRARRGALLAEWERMYRERFPDRDLPSSVVRNHLAALLEELAEAVERMSGVRRASTRHATARRALGISLEEVTAEYALLRRALVEGLGVAEVQPGAAELAALHGVLDDAVARAVEAYVRGAEAQAAPRRMELRGVLAQLPAGVMVTDPSARLLLANPQLEALLRRPFPPGTDLMALTRTIRGYHPDGRPIEEAEWPLARSLRTGEEVHGELVDVVRADGSRLSLSVSSAPVRDPAGQVVAGVVTFEDVGERRRVEAERDRFFALSQDLLVMAGMDGYFKRVNPAGSRTLGWSEGELLSRPFMDLVHPEDQPSVRGHLDRMVLGGAASQFTARVRCRDGGYRWIAWSATPVPAEGLLFAVGRDVTEARRSEAAQRLLAEAGAVLASAASLDYEATLASVARMAVPGFADWCVVDVAFGDRPLRRVEVAFADPADAPLAQRLARYSPAYGPQSPAWRAIFTGRAVLVPEGTEAAVRAVAQGPEHLELLHALRPRSLLAVPLLAQGETLGVLTFLLTREGRRYGPEDMALGEELGRRAALAVDNARLHRNAQEARGFLLAVLQSSPFGIGATSPDGTIRLFNAAAERMLGWRAEEVVGQATPLKVHVPEELAARAQELSSELGRPVEPGFEVLVTHARQGALEEREWTLVRKDGSRFPARVLTTAARSERGALLGFTRTYEDITARKQQEERERRRGEFEQQLLGIVSHDLRNPLAAISLGAATLLQRGGLDERQVTTVRRIQSSAQRAGRMIRDLLDFTQARLGGGLTLRPAPLDLHGFVRLVVDEVLLAGYPEREVRFERQGDGCGQFDSDRMAQLVGNLVVNALKYGAPDTPVTVRTVGEDGWVRLEVHNLGAPIPPEQQGRIFEPMRRATDMEDGGGRSVGLGLYIVRHIVQAHGGTIGLRSTAEEGTTFTVRLPRVPPGGGAGPERCAPVQ